MRRAKAVVTHAGRRQPAAQQFPVQAIELPGRQLVKRDRAEYLIDVPLDGSAVLPEGVRRPRGRDVVQPPVQQVSYAACVAFGDLPAVPWARKNYTSPGSSDGRATHS
jgi:hypothetical protein